LAEHCLRQLRDQHGETGSSPLGLGASALDALHRQAWPGNVRELFNVLEEAAAMCTGPALEASDLASAIPPSPGAAPDAPGPLPTLAEAEQALIVRALGTSGGNKLQAARQLGISRTRLYAKLAKYGLA